MENNNDNYEKLVSQYWMQNVLRLKQYPNTPIQVNAQTLLKHCHNNESYLELTPLHLITDEDAIKIANRCLGLLSGHSYLIEKSISGNEFYVKISNSSYMPSEKEFGCNVSYLPTDVTDDLRLKGIAIPYNGLSVSEQVERGWGVLKTKI